MAVVADLASLKAMLGITGERDDALLQQGLDAAKAWVTPRVYDTKWLADEVQEATLLLASRLYKRRLSPEGVAGWADLGVVRITAQDPDIDRLLEAAYDMTKAGVA